MNHNIYTIAVALAMFWESGHLIARTSGVHGSFAYGLRTFFNRYPFSGRLPCGVFDFNQILINKSMSLTSWCAFTENSKRRMRGWGIRYGLSWTHARSTCLYLIIQMIGQSGTHKLYRRHSIFLQQGGATAVTELPGHPAALGRDSIDHNCCHCCY